MNYFLGIFPDGSLSKDLEELAIASSKIIEAQNVPMYTLPAEKLHITLLFLGNSLSLAKRALLYLRLNRYQFKAQKLSLNNLKLGITHYNREILYLTVEEGAEYLREEVFRLSPLLGVKREKVFIPHMTLGRARKELTEEEYLNLSQDVEGFSENVYTSKFSFEIESISLIQSDGVDYKLLRKFSVK